MFEISGLFKTGEIKKSKNNKKFMLVTNSTRDNENNKENKIYFFIWLSEKISNVFSPEIKKEIAQRNIIIKIEGLLIITKENDKYFFRIVPKKVEKYQKSQV